MFFFFFKKLIAVVELLHFLTVSFTEQLSLAASVKIYFNPFMLGGIKMSYILRETWNF